MVRIAERTEPTQRSGEQGRAPRETRVLELAGDAARGMATIQRAMQTVPSHRDKAARLIARTAQRAPTR